MSRTQQFIDNHREEISDSYDGIVREITKKRFETETKGLKQKQVYCVSGFDCWDIEDAPHPLQRIYEIADFSSSYDNWAYTFQFEFMFKYKGKYYEFQSYGGN